MMVKKLVFFLLVAVSISSLSSATFAETALSPSATVDPTALSIIYDPDSGRVTAQAPDVDDLTALKLLSANSAFTLKCENLPGGFDLCKEDQVFKLVTNGFDSVDFGEILPAGISGADLLNDLTVDGASVSGGFETGSGAILVHSDFAIPEPSGILLVCSALLCLASCRGRR